MTANGHANKRAKAIIANALIWAAIIIGSSLLAGDDSTGDTVLMLLIGGWFAAHSLISGSDRPRDNNCRAASRIGRRKPR